MARYKYYSYEQTILVAIAYSKQILQGTLEYAISWLINNRVDLSIFECKYRNDETGAPAWDPAIMLKIVLFAYSRGIYSSRKIACACRENILFKALSADSEPHFTTIASFISSTVDQVIPIFRNILMVCSELGLIGGNMFALDGCKMSSNASKEWSGTFNDLMKKKEKFEETIKFLIEKHRETDEREGKKESEKENEKKQIERIRQKVEKIERFLAENEPKIGSRGREKQSNITDNESAKMKTSHGMVQGYNGLAIADSKHQIIINPEVFGSGQEGEYLQQMVEGAKDTAESIGLGKNYFKGKKFIADTNNFSEDNTKYLSEEEVDAYIPDQQFRNRDPRFKTRDRHRPEKKERYKAKDFTYDENNDSFICPTGKILKFERIQNFNNTEGRFYRAKLTDCRSCKLRENCLKSYKSRQRSLYIIEKFFNRNYSEEMIKKIDTIEGRNLYSKRMGIIEPVFGNIVSSKGLNRFTLRTKLKVNIQWVLYCLVHNIEKICNYGDMSEYDNDLQLNDSS